MQSSTVYTPHPIRMSTYLSSCKPDSFRALRDAAHVAPAHTRVRPVARQNRTIIVRNAAGVTLPQVIEG